MQVLLLLVNPVSLQSSLLRRLAWHINLLKSSHMRTNLWSRSLIDHHVRYLVSPTVRVSKSLSLRIRFEACQLASSSLHAWSQMSFDHALFHAIGIFPALISCIVLKTPKITATSRRLKIGLLNQLFRHSTVLSQKTFSLSSKNFLIILSGSILRIERIKSSCLTRM